jgi:2-polyprenyl-6-methoxyphenol hydroxylase-like FAD-dependent oxidoreductase
MSRQKWLEVVRSHIKDKSKLRSRTGIMSYEQNDDGVIVTADNGETFEGSILVGADGIHSAVRLGSKITQFPNLY